MRTSPTGDRPSTYLVRVEGRLPPRWAAWFDGASPVDQGDGTSVVSCRADQAALHGLLGRVRDLGLPLVSVTRTDATPPGGPTHVDAAGADDPSQPHRDRCAPDPGRTP